MKRASVVSLLVVCLALPAAAAPRDQRDAPRLGRGEPPIQRIVKIVVKKLRFAVQSWQLGDPRP
jgi:hypothetical protein